MQSGDELHDAIVAVSDVSYSVGPTSILKNVDLNLPAGRVAALLGPSGCGKTTLLRLIAGLIAPTSGSIKLDGRLVAGNGAWMPPERRGLGMVFQDYALWPHLSVGDNIAFPLEMMGISRDERRQRVAEALRRVGLDGMEDRAPSSLSGGQQQRVAIARAIVGRPRIVLFDEPLSNLDRERREALVGEIAQLVRELGVTAVYVTHDQAEAFALADLVAVMERGEIIQAATPEMLVAAPVSTTVASFLNLGTIFDVTRSPHGWRLDELESIVPAPDSGPATNEAKVLLRRTAIRLCDPADAVLRGVVTASQFRSDRHLLSIRIGTDAASYDLTVESPARGHVGESVGIRFSASDLVWFAPESATSTSQEILINAA